MAVSNKRYEVIKTIITDFLEDYDVNSWPFNIIGLMRNVGIAVVRYSSFSLLTRPLLMTASEDSFYAKIGNRYTVFYNDSAPETRVRFSLAHELAHIVLEHLEESDDAEVEANFFASYILAPAPLAICFCNAEPGDVASRFYISYDCAEAIVDRTTKRMRYGKSGFTDYEHRLLNLAGLEAG